MNPTSVARILALYLVPAIHAVAAFVVSTAISYSLRHSLLIGAGVGGLLFICGFVDVERLRAAKARRGAADLSRPLAVAESIVLGLPYVFLSLSFFAAVVVGSSYRAEVAAMTIVAGVLLGRFVVEQVFFRQSTPPDDEVEEEFEVYRHRTWK